jgi:hypothetical protein
MSEEQQASVAATAVVAASPVRSGTGEGLGLGVFFESRFEVQILWDVCNLMGVWNIFYFSI